MTKPTSNIMFAAGRKGSTKSEIPMKYPLEFLIRSFLTERYIMINFKFRDGNDDRPGLVDLAT